MKTLLFNLIPYLAILLGFVGSFLRVIEGGLGFGLVLIGVLLGALLFVLGVVLFFTKKFPSLARKLMIAQCVLFTGLFWVVLSGLGTPLINDISTDLVNPPQFQEIGAERDMSFPSENVEIIKKSYPKLESFELDHSASRVFDAARSLIEETPHWTIARSALELGHIEATAETVVFGFRDDFVVRIKALSENKTQLDLRSKSRVGKGDRGQNLQRILIFYEGLTKKLQNY